MKTVIAGVLMFAVLHSFAQTGSEIYLFDLKSKKGQVTITSNGQRVRTTRGDAESVEFVATAGRSYQLVIQSAR